MKKVVTCHDKDGKSVFGKIGEPQHVIKLPGMAWKELWATYPEVTIPADPTVEPTKSDRWKSIFPNPGETICRILEFDPDEEFTYENLKDPEVLEKVKKELPGMVEHIEGPDDLGMHTTDSIDYIFVLSGNVTLELDDRQKEDLAPGDVVIQNGTRHAWRFKEKTTLLCVLVGAKRV